MSIFQEYGEYFLQCDICNDIAEETFGSFDETVEFKSDRENGWTSRKTKAVGWQDVCPECGSPRY